MTNAGLPVPPGFTISTAVCNIYYKEHRKIPPAIDREIAEQLKKLEKAAGATLGSTENPLLVSVRSGAKFSMPGMMDTILNLGLNDDAVEGLKRRTGNGRFAFDSYRASSRCSAASCWRFRRRVRARVRGRKSGARRQARYRPRRAGARTVAALQEGRQGSHRVISQDPHHSSPWQDAVFRRG
jgi:hypothetical protein